MPDHILITGSAGFIGSHLTARFLADGHQVTGIDNLIWGSRSNLVHAHQNPRFQFYEADAANPDSLSRAIRSALTFGPVHCLWHLAANSDIGAGAADPDIDLRNTFLTTFQILKAMREFGIPRIAFASTSAIYGNLPGLLREESGPLFPISNYGAMKLASEAAISAAVESFLEHAWIFRFPNVVGSHATHGVIYDLLHKLAQDQSSLEVLGDGTQRKPYLHVSELIEAMRYIVRHANDRLNYFNIGVVKDHGATVSYIAESACRHAAPGTPIRYTGGDRGWIGDVPQFQYSTAKLDRLGWKAKLQSTEAVDRAVAEICREIGLPCKS